MLSKSELIAEVAESSGESKAAVERVLTAFQDTIIDNVVAGEKVNVSGFVSFSPEVRQARTMRSPQTGEPIDVPETKVVRIRPLKHFKETVANA